MGPPGAGLVMAVRHCVPSALHVAPDAHCRLHTARVTRPGLHHTNGEGQELFSGLALLAPLTLASPSPQHGGWAA